LKSQKVATIWTVKNVNMNFVGFVLKLTAIIITNIITVLDALACNFRINKT
jgi:hypothetical protein